MALFDQADLTTAVVKKYAETRHFKQPYIPFPKGFVQGMCNINAANGWRPEVMPGWNMDWTTSAFQEAAPGEEGVHCDEYVL